MICAKCGKDYRGRDFAGGYGFPVCKACFHKFYDNNYDNYLDALQHYPYDIIDCEFKGMFFPLRVLCLALLIVITVPAGTIMYALQKVFDR